MLGCIQPMSSPMMNRMLGFCSCCAVAGALTTVKAASDANKPSQIVRAALIVASLVDRQGNQQRAPGRGRVRAPAADYQWHWLVTAGLRSTHTSIDVRAN